MTTPSLASASNPATSSLFQLGGLSAKMPIERAAGVSLGSSDAQGIEIAPLAESEAEHTETEPAEVLAFRHVWSHPKLGGQSAAHGKPDPGAPRRAYFNRLARALGRC